VASSYYEDDGATYAFEQGSFHRRAIRFDPKRREVTLDRADGSYPSKFKVINAVFHGFPSGSGFMVNGRDAASRTLASPPSLTAVSVPFRASNDPIVLHWH